MVVQYPAWALKAMFKLDFFFKAALVSGSRMLLNQTLILCERVSVKIQDILARPCRDWSIDRTAFNL